MKTITPGKNARQRMDGRTAYCTGCSGSFEITSDDVLEYHSDQRDGNYYSIKCPTDGCGRVLTITQQSYTSGNYMDR